MINSDMFFDQIVEIHGRVEREFRKLMELQSKYDRMLSEKYHELEGAKFNVVNGYRFAKEIQTILKKRRVVKGEVAKLLPIRNALSDVQGLNEKYQRAVKKNNEIREQVNATMTIEDLLGGLS